MNEKGRTQPSPLMGEEIKTPFYKGKGEHSVKELEQICTDYEEYRYQQQLIKQDLLKSLIEVHETMWDKGLSAHFKSREIKQVIDKSN